MSNDTSSFGLSTPKRTDGATDFNRLRPTEIALIVAISQRIVRWAMDNSSRLRGKPLAAYVDGMIVNVDLATVHLTRGLDLKRMFEADDLSLISDYTAIAENINRPLACFPAHVKLRFAQCRADFRGE